MSEVSFEVISDDTDDPVVTVRFVTPIGDIFAMADVRRVERALVLGSLHMHSDGSANRIGPANLRVLASAIMEALDYDEIIVEGGVRTTGAYPGRRPRQLRFARRRDAAPE